MSERAHITGSVERVTYHNAENGYCVARVKVKGQKDLVTIVGHVNSITPGEFVESTGEWTNHRDFGVQFKAESMKTVHPSTHEGIEKYLGSGMVKGIGPHFAKKLVDAFGLEVFEVIEKNPQALRKVEGIGSVRIQKITSAWEDQKIVREIMVFLQGHGVSTAKAVRIYKTYGKDAIATVQTNPYRLARDIIGIGFKSADIIALNLGVSKTSVIRARAGVNHILMEFISEGHCAYPEDDLIQAASQLLEIEAETLKEATHLEIEDGHLIREKITDRSCLYPAGIHHCEKETANLLRQLSDGPIPWGAIDAQKAIDWIGQQLQITLADLQKEAIATALESKVMVVTGGPGTGKTTLTKSILSILKAKKISMALCSPTGRAAKRLSECTGMEAKTIHRLLGFDPKKDGFSHDQDNPLAADLLLVDEASMVDVSLMHALLKAIRPGAALIIVGDVDQIPSVGPGRVLGSIIDSGVIPTVRLTQIFRQAAQSQIIASAHQINRGEIPDLERKDPESDFYFIASDDPEKTVSTVVELVKNRIPKRFKFDPVRDVQVLCPMNRGGLGARSLNIELQKALNPAPAKKIERFGSTYAPGDKVMVMANDYDKEVFNGDIGFIKDLDLTEQEAILEFDGRDVVFDFSDFDILSLAYATTIHKSQGSEYPAVVVPIAMQHYMMLKRNLVYTGVTRGKKLVILIGQKKALAIAVRSTRHGGHQDFRWNKLADRIRSVAKITG